jgi:guanylate kinase
MSNKGKVFVISGASGTGKSTLCQSLLERMPSLKFSISYTTRPARPGETDGKQYYFVSEESFKSMVKQDEFLEWAEVHGNLYGTSRTQLEDILNSGKHALIDIDTQGANQIKQSGISATFVFVLPPSMEVLRQRLVDRKTDSGEVIERRLDNARQEITEKDWYDFEIINDEVEKAAGELEEIIRKVI